MIRCYTSHFDPLDFRQRNSEDVFVWTKYANETFTSANVVSDAVDRDDIPCAIGLLVCLSDAHSMRRRRAMWTTSPWFGVWAPASAKVQSGSDAT
jgi:hypothetical protein